MKELEPFDFAAHQQGLFDHYLKQAKNPATKAHAWLRVNELARDWPEYYGTLPARLTQAMTESKA